MSAPTRTSLRVASAIPGRLRLKVANRISAEDLQQLGTILAGDSESVTVQTNPHAASLLVLYDHSVLTSDELLARMEAAGIEVTRAGASSNFDAVTGPERIRRMTAHFNTSVTGISNGVELRMLVPVALLTLSVRQALRRRGTSLAHAPWYVLAWYGFDAFQRLNPARKSIDAS